jgi:hypothetical protein
LFAPELPLPSSGTVSLTSTAWLPPASATGLTFSKLTTTSSGSLTASKLSVTTNVAR